MTYSAIIEMYEMSVGREGPQWLILFQKYDPNRRNAPYCSKTFLTISECKRMEWLSLSNMDGTTIIEKVITCSEFE